MNLGDLRCGCGHLVAVHVDSEPLGRGPGWVCTLCVCERLSGLHRTLIVRPGENVP